MLIDIDERKQVELRDAFLVQLDDATRALDDPTEIAATASRLLGACLEADRCAYVSVEADEDHFNVIGDYARGLPSISGRFCSSAFGAKVLHALRTGQAWVVDDVDADPRLGPDDLDAYQRVGIQASINVPLHKAGRLVAGIGVHQRMPRRWRPDEVELVETVAQRMWESIERARLARAARQRAAVPHLG